MVDMSHNLTPGHGRTKGSLNRRTIERTEALREYLLKGNKLFKLLDILFTRLEETPEKVTTKDILTALKWVAPYEVYTIAEQEASERIDQILKMDNPEEIKSQILDFVTKLKAA
ncbi:hypothetical protein K4M64_004546 [Salmonella enterica]|nr:hypothetical protein [Salmonella enterica]